MNKEKLDVVNENNEVLYSEFRDICHRDKLAHRNVHIFIINDKSEVFLKKRVPNRDYPNMWESSVAGHVTSGLTPIEAAIKELHEELIIEETNLTFLSSFKNNNETENQFTHFFVGFYNGSIDVDKEEATEGKFASIDNAHKMNITDNTKMCLKIWTVLKQQFTQK